MKYFTPFLVLLLQWSEFGPSLVLSALFFLPRIPASPTLVEASGLGEENVSSKSVSLEVVLVLLISPPDMVMAVQPSSLLERSIRERIGLVLFHNPPPP